MSSIDTDNDMKLEIMMSKMALRSEFLQNHIKLNMLQIIRNELQDNYDKVVSNVVMDNKKCAKINLNVIAEINPKLIEVLHNLYLYNETELNTPKST
jgi:hypothetical protein